MKKLSELFLGALAAVIADKLLSAIMVADVLAILVGALTGLLEKCIADLSIHTLTSLPDETVIVLGLSFLLYTLSIVIITDRTFRYHRSKRDVLFIKDSNIKLAYYVNQGVLDPFPFCRKHEIRMNPPELSRSMYRCAECGDEIQIDVYSPEWEYRKNAAISKVERILRGRKRWSHGA